MAQVIDAREATMGRGDGAINNEIEIEVDTSAESDTAPLSPSARDSDAITMLGRALAKTSRRVKITAVIVSVLCLLGLSIALTAHIVGRETGDGGDTTAMGGDAINPINSLEATPSGDEDGNGPHTFLKVAFSGDGSNDFVLRKENWNASFIVYPTVAKSPAPVVQGTERGSILLETTDYTFHFEMSPNQRYLRLVQEYHYATLDQNSTTELQEVFDNSQWPGYITEIPIYMETKEAYHIPSDIFLSNGFFVTSGLVSQDLRIVEASSAFFPRNAMIFVEYELDIGVVVISYAIGLLPEEIMAQRVADDRVGYFSKHFTHYGIGDQESKLGDGHHTWDPRMTVINRRKLEFDPTINATKDPVTYYIDPSVPPRWRKSFAAGVEAWAPAFEQIGLSHAIRAVLPGDADWPDDYRLGDLRYNSISVMISDSTYAYGPRVVDPRSGEILHSDIVFEYGFFDEVMSDFDVRSPVVPPHASKSGDAESRVSDARRKSSSHDSGRIGQCGFAHSSHHQVDRVLLSAVMGGDDGFVPERLIAQHFADIVMHEVGHTLGLRHNFAGSTAYSRKQLRDPAFVAEHGISSSIMDYLPVNIFSDLTEDERDTHAFYMTAIGSYDYAAIAYGYSIIDGEKPGFSHPQLTSLAEAAPLFLTDESLNKQSNPFSLQFDLSSDPVDFASDRLTFVQRSRNDSSVLDKIPEGTSWTWLWRREHARLKLVSHAVNFVSPMLGGVNVTNAHRRKGESSYHPEFVSESTQRRALEVLTRIISAEPGLFPEPEDYATYIETMGYGDEDCNEPSQDYGCLARGLVDMDAVILEIREVALVAALFPVLTRIVQQDVKSPLSLKDVFELVEEAVATDSERPRNQVLQDFYYEALGVILSATDVDSRIKAVIHKLYVDITPAPVVPGNTGEEGNEGRRGQTS